MYRRRIFIHLSFVSAARSIRRGSMRRLYCSNYSKIKWTSGSTTNCHSGVTLSASEVQAVTSSTIRGIIRHTCKHQFPIHFTGRERENVLARLHARQCFFSWHLLETTFKVFLENLSHTSFILHRDSYVV